MSVPTEREITVEPITNESSITDSSHQLFEAQGEWDLSKISYSKATITKWLEFDQLKYQVKSTGYEVQAIIKYI